MVRELGEQRHRVVPFGAPPVVFVRVGGFGAEVRRFAIRPDAQHGDVHADSVARRCDTASRPRYP